MVYCGKYIVTALLCDPQWQRSRIRWVARQLTLISVLKFYWSYTSNVRKELHNRSSSLQGGYATRRQNGTLTLTNYLQKHREWISGSPNTSLDEFLLNITR